MKRLPQQTLKKCQHWYTEPMPRNKDKKEDIKQIIIENKIDIFACKKKNWTVIFVQKYNSLKDTTSKQTTNQIFYPEHTSKTV